jgi:hypothetical protein
LLGREAVAFAGLRAWFSSSILIVWNSNNTPPQDGATFSQVMFVSVASATELIHVGLSKSNALKRHCYGGAHAA